MTKDCMDMFLYTKQDVIIELKLCQGSCIVSETVAE